MTDIIIGGHQDIAWNHFNHGRDFTRRPGYASPGNR